MFCNSFLKFYISYSWLMILRLSCSFISFFSFRHS